jgi:hypothetical protein
MDGFIDGSSLNWLRARLIMLCGCDIYARKDIKQNNTYRRFPSKVCLGFGGVVVCVGEHFRLPNMELGRRRKWASECQNNSLNF